MTTAHLITAHVGAILRLLQTALDDSRRCDYFELLSGSDYPLQPTSYIEPFFERNNDREFMNLIQVPENANGLLMIESLN